MPGGSRCCPEWCPGAAHLPAGKDPGGCLHQPDRSGGARMTLRGSLAIWHRDMLVLRRNMVSELVAVVAYPLTIYLAFGVGMKGYIGLVDGVPYSLFIAPG